jgi:hypothetical protein
MTPLRHSLRSSLLLTVLTLFAIVSPISAAQIDDVSPRLSVTVFETPAAGTLLVEGHDFTPGGEIKVYILAYYQGGMDHIETRSVVAADASFGPNGSADPALGYVPGGTFSETFRSLCRMTPMVRAYDVQRDAWSDWLDIDPGC